MSLGALYATQLMPMGNFFPIAVFYLMGATRCYAPIG